MTILPKLRKVVLLLLVVIMLSPTLAYADSPYKGYTYTNDNDERTSINGYLYKDSIDGIGLDDVGVLKAPEDIFITQDDTIYIVDSGNHRVIHLTPDLKVVGTYGEAEGAGKLNTPKGVYVDKDGNVYVADTMNRRVVEFNSKGEFMQEFLQPTSPLLGKDFVYSPSKLVVDKRGYLFVVSDGATQGMLQIRPDGSFAGFFGANHVGYSLTRNIVKLIASKEQKAQLASVKPPEFSNMFQDTEGFIYTSSLGIRFNQVKRLSAVGVDTLNTGTENRYGDYYMREKNGTVEWDAFVDVSVSRTGMINALDQTTGRIFQYDKIGNLLFISGGIGTQDGLFVTASSIAETSDGVIYVADRMRNRIDRFYPTPFAEIVHTASELYVDGRYDEASGPWHEVLEMNSNYDLAYFAIGKALYRQQRYDEAMKYYKQAKMNASYSDALHEYRKVFMRENFGAIATSLIIFIFVVLFTKRALKNGWFRKIFRAMFSKGEAAERSVE